MSQFIVHVDHTVNGGDLVTYGPFRYVDTADAVAAAIERRLDDEGDVWADVEVSVRPLQTTGDAREWAETRDR